MALISCPDCNKEVSDKAEKCLNCGAPIAPSQKEVTPEFILNEKWSSKYEIEKKSPAAAIFIAFIFGPFGTFYANIFAGFVMIGVYLFSLFGSVIGVLIASIVNMFICYFFASESNEVLKAKLLIEQGREKLSQRNISPEKPEDFAENAITENLIALAKCEECNTEIDSNNKKAHTCSRPDTSNGDKESIATHVKQFIIPGVTIIAIGILVYIFYSSYSNRPIVVLTGIDYLATCQEIPSSDMDIKKHKQFSSLEKCNSSSEKITLQKNLDDEIKDNLKKLKNERQKK